MALHFLLYSSFSMDFFDSVYTKLGWIECLTDLVLFSFHVNILYPTRVIALIKRNVLLWIEELEDIKTKHVQVETQYWKIMFKTYSSIMDSYFIYIKVFQELVSIVRIGLMYFRTLFVIYIFRSKISLFGKLHK